MRATVAEGLIVLGMDASVPATPEHVFGQDLYSTIRSLEQADAHLGVIEAGLWAILDGPASDGPVSIQDAASAWRMKDEILAGIRREVRSPLGTVLGVTSMLLGGEPDPERRMYAETVRESGVALRRLLDQVVECEPGEVETSPLTTLSARRDGPVPAAPRSIARADPTPGRDSLDATVVEELRVLAYGERTPGFLEELVWLFTAEVGRKVAELEEAFRAGDLEAVLQIAHAINGCASQVGATDVVAICAGLEVASSSGALVGREPEVVALRAAFDRACDALTDTLTDC